MRCGNVAHGLAAGQFPHTDHFISTERRGQSTVRRYSDGRDLIAVGVELDQRFGGCRVPDVDTPVSPAGGEPFPVWADRDRRGFAMLARSKSVRRIGYFLAVRPIPNVEVGLFTGRNELLSILVKACPVPYPALAKGIECSSLPVSRFHTRTVPVCSLVTCSRASDLRPERDRREAPVGGEAVHESPHAVRRCRDRDFPGDCVLVVIDP